MWEQTDTHTHTDTRDNYSNPRACAPRVNYTIIYRAGGSSDSVGVDGGNRNSHTLMGLTNGDLYIIFVVGTLSGGLPSPQSQLKMLL